MIRLYKTSLSTGYNLSLYFSSSSYSKEGERKSWDRYTGRCFKNYFYCYIFKENIGRKKASYPITTTPFRGGNLNSNPSSKLHTPEFKQLPLNLIGGPDKYVYVVIQGGLGLKRNFLYCKCPSP